MEPIGKKIKKYREQQGLTAPELAQKIGVKSKNIIYNWETGIGNPDYKKIKELCSALHVSADTLIETDFANAVFSPFEMEIIKKYRKLDAYGKRAVDNLLDVEFERVDMTSAQSHNLLPMRFFRMPVSAGTGNFLDSNEFDNIYVPFSEEAEDADYAIEVRGDSMEPKFYDGDKVLVKTQSTVDIGDIGIFMVNDDVYIKELGENKLISLNEKYKPILLRSTDSTYCLGKVLAVI